MLGLRRVQSPRGQLIVEMNALDFSLDLTSPRGSCRVRHMVSAIEQHGLYRCAAPATRRIRVPTEDDQRLDHGPLHCQRQLCWRYRPLRARISQPVTRQGRTTVPTRRRQADSRPPLPTLRTIWTFSRVIHTTPISGCLTHRPVPKSPSDASRTISTDILESRGRGPVSMANSQSCSQLSLSRARVAAMLAEAIPLLGFEHARGTRGCPTVRHRAFPNGPEHATPASASDAAHGSATASDTN